MLHKCAQKNPPKVHINFSPFDPLRLPGPNLWILKKSDGKIVCRLCQEKLHSRGWIHIPPWEKENHLQNAIFGGYVSFLEGIPPASWTARPWKYTIPQRKESSLPSNHRFFRGKLAVKLPGVYHLEEFRVWTQKNGGVSFTWHFCWWPNFGGSYTPED